MNDPSEKNAKIQFQLKNDCSNFAMPCHEFAYEIILNLQSQYLQSDLIQSSEKSRVQESARNFFSYKNARHFEMFNKTKVQVEYSRLL